MGKSKKPKERLKFGKRIEEGKEDERRRVKERERQTDRQSVHRERVIKNRHGSEQSN